MHYWLNDIINAYILYLYYIFNILIIISWHKLLHLKFLFHYSKIPLILLKKHILTLIHQGNQSPFLF